MNATTSATAARIGEILKFAPHHRLVFAESCTGGMAAALLTQVPGISAYFCGSAVTYRNATKIAWLDVSKETIKSHTAESQETTDAMAIQALVKTPEATIACAITGHLGPGINVNRDGVIFVSIIEKSGAKLKKVESDQIRLSSTTRTQRQLEAAEFLLHKLESWLLTKGQN